MLALAFSIAVAAFPAPSPAPTPSRVALAAEQAPEPTAEPEGAAAEESAPADPTAERQREENALEQDMDRARQHIHEGEHTHDGDEHSAHSHDHPDQVWRRYDERARATRDRAQRLYGHDDPEYQGTPRFHAVPPVSQPTIEGHGKAYFLTWGIVDYAIAGQLWLGGTMLGLVAVTLGVGADEIARDSRGEICGKECNDRQAADAIRAVAVTWGVVAIGAVVTGVVFASKAEANLDKHGTLVSAARSRGPRPRSQRDWDEHADEYEIEVDHD